MSTLYFLLVPLFAFIVFDQFRKLSQSVRERNKSEILIYGIFLTVIIIICVMLVVLIQGMTR